MLTENLDIVYCVKNKPVNEELRYSLRSLENIPHNKVWIFGGCPDWVNTETVNYVPTEQNFGDKWTNTSNLLMKIINTPEVSETFIWFNDDFFVLKEVDNLPYYFDRTIMSRVSDFSKISWMAMSNRYCSRLKNASRALKMEKLKTLNYELHLPMIFEKEKFRKMLNTFPSIGAKRSLYGNMFVEGAIKREDVKIYDNENIPGDDWDFVSTSDISFAEGKVGKYIRKKFKVESPYERKETKWKMKTRK